MFLNVCLFFLKGGGGSIEPPPNPPGSASVYPGFVYNYHHTFKYPHFILCISFINSDKLLYNNIASDQNHARDAMYIVRNIHVLMSKGVLSLKHWSNFKVLVLNCTAWRVSRSPQVSPTAF